MIILHVMNRRAINIAAKKTKHNMYVSEVCFL